MNLTKQISRYSFALPLLFACVALSSCDNEKESDLNLPVGQTATFSANALTAETRSASTRVSLQPGNGIADTDGLSWELTDKLNFIFTNASGNPVGAPTPAFEVTSIDTDGSAEIEGTIPNVSGTFNVTSVSPFKPEFQGGNSNNITVSTVQTQAANKNYSYLKNDLYLYAHAANGITVVNSSNYTVEKPLNYKLLTSLLRFDIKNSANQNITIKSLKLKIADDNSNGTFYTTGRLSIPNGTLIGQNADAGKTKDLTLNVPNVVLDDNQTYIGYMNVIPTDNAGNMILTIEVVDASNDTWNLEFDLKNISAFASGYRYAASIELVPEDFEEEEYPEYPFTPMEYGDFLFTPLDYFKWWDGVHMFEGVAWVKGEDLPNIPCPKGYSVMDAQWCKDTYLTAPRFMMLLGIKHPMGYIHPDYPNIIQASIESWYIYDGAGTGNAVSKVTRFQNGGILAINNFGNTSYLVLRCVKPKN